MYENPVRRNASEKKVGRDTEKAGRIIRLHYKPGPEGRRWGRRAGGSVGDHRALKEKFGKVIREPKIGR